MDINEIDDYELGSDIEEVSMPDPDEIEADGDNFEEHLDESGYEEHHYEEEDNEDTGDAVDYYLQSKGINPRAVKFETENGPEEVDFRDLPTNEQFQILLSSDADNDYGLTEDEVNIINRMRANNWTSQDYTNYIARQVANNYQARQELESYTVDDYSDAELFIMDLQSKIPDITEEEAALELANALMNEELFNKRTASLRLEYKEQENAINREIYEDRQRKQAQAALQYNNSIAQVLNSNRTIDLGDASIEMSQQDALAVYNFLTQRNAAGESYIQKAVSNPESLTQMAWYLLKGKEAFGEISRYYKLQISDVAKYNYEQGLEDGRSGKTRRTPSSRRSVVRRSNSHSKQPSSINDLDDFI